jgi:hypothetical protein
MSNEIMPSDAGAVEGVVAQPPLPATQQPSGPLFPTAPVIQKKTYSSAMSYVGTTRRTVAWVKRVGTRSSVAAVAAWTAGVLFLIFMYVFLLGWYFVVFVLFGVFTFPFRLIRRGQRKEHHLQETQLATMQAMLVQQQQALIQNQQTIIQNQQQLPPS